MGPRFQEIPQRKRILENKSVIFRERKATIWIIIMSPPKKKRPSRFDAHCVWCTGEKRPRQCDLFVTLGLNVLCTPLPFFFIKLLFHFFRSPAWMTTRRHVSTSREAERSFPESLKWRKKKKEKLKKRVTCWQTKELVRGGKKWEGLVCVMFELRRRGRGCSGAYFKEFTGDRYRKSQTLKEKCPYFCVCARSFFWLCLNV